MSRLLFFLLLVANLAFGTHLWLSASASEPDFSLRERNRDEARIIAVIPPIIAARRAEETRMQVQTLSGAACVEFAGVAAADLPQAREAFAAMQLGDRYSERRVEEITRHWVFIAPAKDRRTAEQSAALLRQRGITELSIRPDHAISLGVFSTEEAARRYLAQIEAKGTKGAQVGPFAKEVRDSVFLVRDPDTQLVARMALLQRDHPTSTLRAVSCPAPEGNGAAAAKAPGQAAAAQAPQAQAPQAQPATPAKPAAQTPAAAAPKTAPQAPAAAAPKAAAPTQNPPQAATQAASQAAKK